jgi:uncharacterized membrane protein YoaK (UPF0700 family)
MYTARRGMTMGRIMVTGAMSSFSVDCESSSLCGDCNTFVVLDWFEWRRRRLRNEFALVLLLLVLLV